MLLRLYKEIMNADVTDFSKCTNMVALYNKRVLDVKENLGLINSLIAQNEEEKEKEQKALDARYKKIEQYKEVAKRAYEAGNKIDELKAKEELSKMLSLLPLFEENMEYFESNFVLLERAHEKLIKDAEKLKEMESTITNQYTGTPKTVSANPDSENIEEKKEPKFSVYTNMIID